MIDEPGAPVIRKIDRAEVAGPHGAFFAQMLLAAVPEYYGLIPGGRAQVLAIVADQVCLEGSEQEHFYYMSRDDRPVAIISGLLSDHLDAAKRVSMFQIASQLSDDGADTFLQRLKGYESSVEQVPGGAYYISRLATHPDARRMGAASRFMRFLMDHNQGRPYALQVHRDNAPIIAVHTKLGFRFQSNDPFEFRTMVQ